jgi:hypothetical protein
MNESMALSDGGNTPNKLNESMFKTGTIGIRAKPRTFRLTMAEPKVLTEINGQNYDDLGDLNNL